ncbi:ABC transporter substrate-binding protein [Thermopolyspora flexuosa]|uniref:Iron complex transport system substrate-binding protein n=1 Tax=Thermopolyspora flexuosa TaxID=103836 RepID=A0A543IQA4_9ACTN|nr:ABC transporter substrate-binding protein [Thermopolyspora flexuosa]TQM72754.1 iron complex transport system substrate-binding protein [Thermopolyspora flexuosa]
MRRLVLLLVSVLVVAGCGSRPATHQAAADRSGAQHPGFPVTIENCGRTYTFDKPPTKVVTGYHPALETLIALGLQDRVAGRTNFSESAFLPGQKEHYDKIPEISPTIMLPQKEIMLSQGADLVIDNSPASFDPAGGYATIDELAAAGTPVYLLGNWCDPESQLEFDIEQIFTDLRNLGAIFGVPDRAEKLITELRAQLDDATRRVADRPKVRVLATDGGKGPVNAYGGTGLTNELIRLAGGENVLADVRADYTEVSAEKIAATDPEALIVSEYATLRGEPMPTAPQKAADTFAIARNSTAAKERRYLPLPVAAQHPGYRNVLAVIEIAKFLHPEAFS